MEAPQRAHAMVREMHEPVAPVHRYEYRGDRSPSRKNTHSWEDDPRERSARDRDERQRQRGHERDDQSRVHNGEQQIVSMAACDQRSPLRRPYALDDEEDADDGERRGTGHDNAEARGRVGEVVTPADGPTDRDEDHRRSRD